MSNPKGNTSFLAEFKQFLLFLQNLWAILAGVSVLFPLSNALTKIVPLDRWPEGGLAYFSPELVSTISTLTCIFIVLWTFGKRHEIRKMRIPMRKRAVISFLAGIFALIIYLATQFAVVDNFYYNVLRLESGSGWRVLGDIVLLLAYSAFFALMTRAFMLLGMLEYFGRRSSPV
jgi:ABC-type xylose transport system permease subunit